MRASKTTSGGTTYFLYDGDDPVCELDGSGNVTAVNTFGEAGLLSRHTSAGSVFYTFDLQGSVAQRLDGSQNVLGSYTFDAFGSRQSTDGSSDPYSGFGGQAGYYTDSETGLELLGHRYHDPAAGRFLTRDPLGYAGGVNLYGYVQNNPINRIDPLGLDSTDDGIVAVSTTIGALGGFVGGGGLGALTTGGVLAVPGAVEGGALGAGLGASVGIWLTTLRHGGPVYYSGGDGGGGGGGDEGGTDECSNRVGANPIKEPLDPTPYEKNPASMPLGPDAEPGDYVYVRDTDGVVHIVPNGDHLHPTVLGGGQSATGAGTLTIGPNGTITSIDNISGTFQFGGDTLPGVVDSIGGQGVQVEPGAAHPFQW